ncbi:hypothetical protein [Inquilinus sp. Marseille-Q2685]|uniref:hypothetical protein n=1 Tax=Inquilinus sp. Marseille-Q2685 TaxID=2866581 RepID=UPI001CE3CAB3|nr:hypothetical protein [Inquilinus sp. Marseille-Q2685]
MPASFRPIISQSTAIAEADLRLSGAIDVSGLEGGDALSLKARGQLKGEIG